MYHNLMVLLLIFGVTLLQSCKPKESAKKSGKSTTKTSPSVPAALDVSAAALVKITSTPVLEDKGKQTVETSAALLDLNESYLGLVLPAKPFLKDTGKADLTYVPFVKAISLAVYANNGKTPLLQLDDLTIDGQGVIAKGLKLYGVGFKLEKQDTSSVIYKALTSQLGTALIQKLENQFISPSPLSLGGVEFRNNYTSFMIIAVPKSIDGKLAELKLPKALASDNRPTEDKIAALSEKGGKLFAVNLAKDAEAQKATPVTAMNSGGDATPLFNFTKTDAAIRRQIWEVSNQGTCLESAIGSPVLWQESETAAPVFIGFVSKAARPDKGFKGADTCKDADVNTTFSTLITSPSKAHYDGIIKLLK
jgi:hypothetical protein